MKTLENIAISLELAKKLKELGVKQQGRVLFYYYNGDLMHNQHSYKLSDNVIPAYTTDELLELLPKKTYNSEPFGLKIMWAYKNDEQLWQVQYFSHYPDSKRTDDRIETQYNIKLPDALAKMLIYLIENKLIDNHHLE